MACVVHKNSMVRPDCLSEDSLPEMDSGGSAQLPILWRTEQSSAVDEFAATRDKSIGFSKLRSTSLSQLAIFAIEFARLGN